MRGEVRECVRPSRRLARSCSRPPTFRGERPPMLMSSDFGLPQPDMATNSSYPLPWDLIVNGERNGGFPCPLAGLFHQSLRARKADVL